MLLSLTLVVVLCGCVTPAEKPRQTPRSLQDDKVRLNSLMKINDLNEGAFAYQQYCLKDTEPMNRSFMENFAVAANLLFDQCQKTLGWEPEYIVSQVVKRREHLQNTLAEYYGKEGCNTPKGKEALEHYRRVSELTKEQIESL